MASTGTATILLPLDRTRQPATAYCGVERTGWKRLLTLTTMLHKAKADYIVEYELVPSDESWRCSYSGPGRRFTGPALELCDDARLWAHVAWILQ